MTNHYHVIKLEVEHLEDRTDFHSLTANFTKSLERTGHHVLQTCCQGAPFQGYAHGFIVSTAGAGQLREIINSSALIPPEHCKLTPMNAEPDAAPWELAAAKPLQASAP